MLKNITFKTAGMQRDYSVSAFNPKYAYENKNLRIITSEDNTLMSLVNEKGTKLSNVKNIGSNIEGTPIGQAVIDNKLILFSAGKDYRVEIPDIEFSGQSSTDIADMVITIGDIGSKEDDIIYKIWSNDGKELEGKELFRGNLKLSATAPIETLIFYENEEIQKVYWVDGINQLRVINTTANNIELWNEHSFDFLPKLKFTESITIEKRFDYGGTFSSGVVQYAFTYFNKYGQESNIFYTSPLLYSSYLDRGGSLEDTVSNSFSININGVDTDFDYIRIYSILRTSLNTTPITKIVKDIKVTDEPISYIDIGEGDSIDPTELLYKNNEAITANTLNQKDNTLFLGNVSFIKTSIPQSILDTFRGLEDDIYIDTKSIGTTPSIGGYYDYSNNLNNNSNTIKIFKYLETYRLGVQLQDANGSWSEPIFIGDKINKQQLVSSFIDDRDVAAGYFKLSIDNDNFLIENLKSLGYVNIRPVIVYPQLKDRTCICQGILCPTVYNVGQRISGNIYSQSSWFARPNWPIDITNDSNDIHKLSDYSSTSAEESKHGILFDTDKTKGTKLACLHNQNTSYRESNNTVIEWRGVEVQCAESNQSAFLAGGQTTSQYNNLYSSNFFVDQSLVTFHSPDLEFDEDIKSLDLSDLKLRIVGIVPLTASSSDIDIIASAPFTRNHLWAAPGFYKKFIGNKNSSYWGYKGLVSGIFWFEDFTNEYDGYLIYPFHKEGCIRGNKTATQVETLSVLKNKKISNLRYSYNSYYFKKYQQEVDDTFTELPINNIWEPIVPNVDIYTFNPDKSDAILINTSANLKEKKVFYYGNIDTAITPSLGNHTKAEYSIKGYTSLIENTNDYIFSQGISDIKTNSAVEVSNELVRMQYKSTPHAVISLGCTTNGTHNDYEILPTLLDGNVNDLSNLYPINSCSQTEGTTFWGVDRELCVQQYISEDFSGKNGSAWAYGPLHGWFWLAELYRDNITNRFGDDDTQNSNIWVCAGETISLNLPSFGAIVLKWTEGDTYYQRYDNLKTYAPSLDVTNGVVDIVSFMCETRVNLDGRYDRNRGNTSNLVANPSNFNLINPVYSQINNYFNFRNSSNSLLNLNRFDNTICWSKTKTSGSLIDEWTSINLINTLEFDGDLGKISAIKKLNNELIVFQDKGISQLLYNENTQIASSAGVPIEIANSGKVNGKRYITNKLGCFNKWSICETPNGFYFIDDFTKDIYLYNGQLDNLSSKMGFHSYLSDKCNFEIWNPQDFNSFITYYDSLNKDVLFISKDECLAFNEVLGQFSSFYNYENTPYFSTIKNKGIMLHKDEDDTYNIWKYREGDYNMFFGHYQPFYTTVIANPDMQLDKIFNTVEFRADTWGSEGALKESTFDTLNVWNEYQEGTQLLMNDFGYPSNIKHKFRIWRANVPRDNKDGRSRIRNTWAYVKLSKEFENTDKTILHDMVVHYFE